MIAALTTDRLSLRPPRRRDGWLFWRLWSDGQVRAYLGGPVPLRPRLGRLWAFLRRGAGASIWVAEAQGRGIGVVTLSPHHDGEDVELSYEILPSAWGQGYGAEAARAILDHALGAMGLPRVIAETQSANVRSRRLLDRLGMVEVRRVERFGAEQVIYATR